MGPIDQWERVVVKGGVVAGGRQEVHAAASLPATLASARRARSFVRGAVQPLLSDDALDTVELLTSEVVTNAVVHTGAAPVVSVSARMGAVRVSVEDPDPAVPLPRTVADTDLCGRGLSLVDTYAAAWGVELLPRCGKRVWFEVLGPERRWRPVHWS